MKKLYSIKTQVLAIIVCTIIIIAVAVGGLSLLEVSNYVQLSADEMVKVTCEKESEQINSVFQGMEKSVQIMESYVLGMIESREDFTNLAGRNNIINSTEEMFHEVANNTDGAMAYYLRFDPSFSDNKTGFFYSKNSVGDKFNRLTPTDLSLYPRDDVERVGWYWQPYVKGAPLWMMPYYNQNIDIKIISYVIPLYYKGAFIGIVGMDFDYAELTEKVDGIKLYENGFAQLTNQYSIVYHPTLEPGSPMSNVDDEYISASQTLKNDMTLTVFASYEDIEQIKSDIVRKTVVAVFLVFVVLSVCVAMILRHFITPLERLTNSAMKMAEGNYDIEVIHSNTREIEVLSTAFEHMALQLHEHDRLQHLLAYRDSLTGLRNTTSYKAWVDEFNSSFDTLCENLAVVVLDINYLKETNDKYGHDVGNKLIVAAANLISETFKRSAVFRIGGDEFLAVLKNRDFTERDALIKELEERCVSETISVESIQIPLSIAKGVAICEKGTDKSFVDIFNRADDRMYQNKRKMKQGTEYSIK